MQHALTCHSGTSARLAARLAAAGSGWRRRVTHPAWQVMSLPQTMDLGGRGREASRLVGKREGGREVGEEMAVVGKRGAEGEEACSQGRRFFFFFPSLSFLLPGQRE